MGTIDVWGIEEFQPNIPNGGRLNTFAIDPHHTDTIYAAAESGGLFKSTDTGAHWSHLNGLPCFSTNAVACLNTPHVVLATTNDDFKSHSGGGIWRSTDDGASWAQITLPNTVDPRASAWAISVVPGGSDIYVGCSNGVLKSTTHGASWTLHPVFGSGEDARVFSVAALGGGHVLAAGPSGVRYSTNDGGNWNVPTTGVGGVWDLHALGRSVVSQSHGYVVNGDTHLFFTSDGGDNWTQIVSAAAGGGSCGGISFAKTVNLHPGKGAPGPHEMMLYFGNRCGIYRLLCPFDPVAHTVDHSGSWSQLGPDHGDTRDICFHGSTPILLGTDGGIHYPTQGGKYWFFIGGGDAGYNALQITEVRGQYVEDIGSQDMYFGTQDNNLYSTNTLDRHWTYGSCCEGFFIEATKRVATASQSKVTFVACGPCGNITSDRLFTNNTYWTNPAGSIVGNPMILRNSRHIQGVDTTSGFAVGFAATSNLGGSWSQWASFADDRRDIPKLALPGGGKRSEAVYQAYRAGWDAGLNIEINKLARLVKKWNAPTATVHYPAMTNFGGLGINPTMFAWYQVYAVNPGDYRHIIAPDVINNRMKETHDGGETWTDMPDLTDLVTDFGRLRFSNSIFPIVSALSFCPDDPSRVLVGTVEGGAFASMDTGQTWNSVFGSAALTYTTSFHWLTGDDIIASSYGRGLFRIRHRRFCLPREFEQYCKAPCLPWEFRRPEGDPPEWDFGILVEHGRVMGVRYEGTAVREVFVTPGASLLFFGEESRATMTITRTTKYVGFGRAKPGANKKGWFVKGLRFAKDDSLRTAILTNREQGHLAIRDEHDEPKKPQTRSPTVGKAVVRIQAESWAGAPVVASGKTLALAARGLSANTAVHIEIDGERPPNESRLEVGAKGLAAAKLPAPLRPGLHTIVLKEGDRVIDGSMFLVKHEDCRPDEEEKVIARKAKKPSSKAAKKPAKKALKPAKKAAKTAKKASKRRAR